MFRPNNRFVELIRAQVDPAVIDRLKPIVGLGDEESPIGVGGGKFVIKSGTLRHPVKEVTGSGAVATKYTG